MSCNFSDLFERGFVNQINAVCDLVDNIKNQAKKEKKKLKWTTNSDWNEYGFYIEGKTTKISLYFGIWFEAWEAFNTPLFFVVDDTKSDTKVNESVRQYVESFNNKYLEYKYFDECSTVVLTRDYFDQNSVHESLFLILKDLQKIIK